MNVPATITDTAVMADLLTQSLNQDHHAYEAMARAVNRLARVGGWRGQRLDRQFAAELSVAVYRPTGNKPPVVAFGNTRLTNATSALRWWAEFSSDLTQDLFPLGIGYYRFCMNEAALKNLLLRLTAQYGQRVVVTGHSLGGALAQLTALRLSRYVDTVVTFQSPKTMREEVHRLRDLTTPDELERLQAQSYHYTVEGDSLVQEAGELRSPGKLLHLRYRDGVIGFPQTYNAHVKEVFTDLAPARASLPAVEAVARQNFRSIRLDLVRGSTDPTQSVESQVTEYIRENAVIYTGVAAVLASRAHPTVSHLVASAALELLRHTIYAAHWTMNVYDFLLDPSHTRVTALEFDTPVGRLSMRDVLSQADLARIEREFRAYVRHTRIRETR